MAKDKPIVVRQRTKGQKVAKALVATFTPLICVGGLAAGGYYAWLKIDDKTINLYTNDNYVTMYWEGRVHMHQELRVEVSIEKTIQVSVEYDMLEIRDSKTDSPVPIQQVDSSYWHIEPDGSLKANTDNDKFKYTYDESETSGSKETKFRIWPSKSGNFKIILKNSAQAKKGGN